MIKKVFVELIIVLIVVTQACTVKETTETESEAMSNYQTFTAFWNELKQGDYKFSKEHISDYITYKTIYTCQDNIDSTIYYSRHLMYDINQFNEQNSEIQLTNISDSIAVVSITIIFNDVKLNFYFQRNEKWKLNNITEEIQCKDHINDMH